MENLTAKLIYDKDAKNYRMYPETAAAGIWMSCNNLFILLYDLLADNKLLKKSTVEMITKGEHPEWQKIYQNYGLGMFVGEKAGQKLIAHNGDNYGYKMGFYCLIPNSDKDFEKNLYIDIFMIRQDPKIHISVEQWRRKVNELLNS